METLFGKYQSRKRYLQRYAKVPYVTYQRELRKAATSSVVFATDSSLARTVPLYLPTKGRAHIFLYIALHLIKIPSHLDRESENSALPRQ